MDIESVNVFNTAMAKRLKSLKKDLSVLSVIQGYKGTGSRSCRRQIFVRFTNDKIIDLWLEESMVLLGGVCRTNYGVVQINGRNVDDVYSDIVASLRPLSDSK